MHTAEEKLAQDIRSRWSGTLLLLRPGRPLSALEDDLKSGLADVVPVGRWALNEADPATFYAGGAKGYVDYPPFDRARHLVTRVDPQIRLIVPYVEYAVPNLDTNTASARSEHPIFPMNFYRMAATRLSDRRHLLSR
jgi:hypothetical protein